MKAIVLVIVTVFILFGCKENTSNNMNSDNDVSDTLRIGKGLRLETPFDVEYDYAAKGPLVKGGIFHEDQLIYTFGLNVNLADDTLKPDQWIISDTVSTSFRKDTLIFNWYKKDELDWIGVKHIYTHASSTSSQYSIHGYSRLGKSKRKELAYLFSEMRKTELADFFDHDSLLINKIVELRNK